MARSEYLIAAIWNFDPKGKQQVPLTVGDEIRLTDENESGWLRGSWC